MCAAAPVSAHLLRLHLLHGVGEDVGDIGLDVVQRLRQALPEPGQVNL